MKAVYLPLFMLNDYFTLMEIEQMKKNYGYPSYNLICKATSGDEKAIREILDFYNAYISCLERNVTR